MTAEKSDFTVPQQLCRLCAEPRDGLVGIYELEGQKHAIHEKITKCLQIQVFANDCLPLFVCLDCCSLLNQCNDFYEKTNQAQYSLRRMMLDSKVDVEENILKNTVLSDIDTDVNDSAKVTDFCKDNNDRNDDVVETNDDFFDNSSEVDKTESQDSKEFKEHKPKNMRKTLAKQIRKKVKKRPNLIQSDESSELQELSLDDIDKECNKSNDKVLEKKVLDNVIDIKSNSKTLDSSETDTIDSNDKMEQSINRKKNKQLDKYSWLCTDCNDKLPSLEALEEHHETVHNQKAKYMCIQCCKVYEKYYGFLTHVKRHKTKAKYSCDDCGKTFAHKKVLDTHKAIHSEERPYVCQTCGKTFRQQSALYIHSRCHLPENMKHRYPCDQCDKRFSTKPNLVTHKRIHSGVRNFTCDQCGKSFIQKGNLEAHFLTHSADKPYSCSQCSKAFKTPLQLRKHESVHTGAKPHQCTVCGRTFREKGTLKEHYRIHTGAMPFSCEFCGKSFRFKGILTTHRRQHTGERPYSCLECQHHFTNWPNYNKHMKRRHGINTSRAKQEQPSHQQQQEAQQNLLSLQQTQQQPQPQLINNQQQAVTNNSNNNVSHSILNSHISSSNVQVIQTVPQMTVTTQPIILQTIPSNTTVTAIQTFAEAVETPSTVSATSVPHHQQQPLQAGVQATAATSNFRERQHVQSTTTTYFNAIGTPLTSFLPPTIPYNFYNIPNVVEADLIHPR